MTKNDSMRMVQWLAVAVVLYVIAWALPKESMTQTIAWKAAQVTGPAWIGYLIARTAVPYVRLHLVWANITGILRSQRGALDRDGLMPLAIIFSGVVLFRALVMYAAIAGMAGGL